MSNDPVRQALDLAAAGRPADAVAMLTAAGDDGNVDALMQHAVWALVGDPIPRDLPAARALLRRAVAIGHVDAALMEVALTANGSGGPADWRHARQLLAKAAASDPVAAQQIALLDAMALDDEGRPSRLSEPRVLSRAPRVTQHTTLLTPAECAHVASVAGNMLQPAQVIDPRSGRWTPHPVRTSDDAAIGPAREDLVIRAINLRVAAISNSSVDQGEPLTVLRYAPGQQYRPHLDTIAGAANQRVRTVLLYLNQGYDGGETVFPEIGLTIAAQGGDVIMFDNVLDDGRPDPASRHAGLPVRRGVKWLATRWIRAAPVDPWNMPAS